MHDRRTFLAMIGSAAAALAAGCKSEPRSAIRQAGALQPPRAIGLQLYTVRSLLARNFEATLDQVGAIGFREVEFAGYHGRSAAAVRATLDRAGLTAPSAHIGVDDVRSAWPRIVDEAATVGHRWITVPWVDSRRWQADDWLRLAELLNERGRDAERAGLRVAYHNHDFELRGDPVPLELLLRETDPAHVDFELDVYWLVRAGGDPLDWLARHPGRFPMLHVKDTAGAPDHRMVDVGAGIIDWTSVIGRAEQASTRHLFVEHDDPADALATARAGYAHLAALRARTTP